LVNDEAADSTTSSADFCSQDEITRITDDPVNYPNALDDAQVELKPHTPHIKFVDVNDANKFSDVPKQIGTQMVSRGECLNSHERIQNSEQNIAIDSIKPTDRIGKLSVMSILGLELVRVFKVVYFWTRAIKGIQGPFDQYNNSKKHSMFASKTNKESSARKNPMAWSKTDQNPRKMSSESSYTQKSARSKTIIARREKSPPHQMVMKPTLLDLQ